MSFLKVLSKASVLLRNHQKVIQHAQHRLVTLPGCPYDTLETHSTPPGHILGPEGSNLQKSTFCVVPSTLKPNQGSKSARGCSPHTIQKGLPGRPAEPAGDGRVPGFDAGAYGWLCVGYQTVCQHILLWSGLANNHMGHFENAL